MSDRIAYKIMSAEELQQMQRDGVFHGSPVDRTDGYIHLSCGSQVAATLDRHFGGVEGLMLVAVDLSRLATACDGKPLVGQNCSRTSMAACRWKQWSRSERWNEPQMERSDCRLSGTLQKVYKW